MKQSRTHDIVIKLLIAAMALLVITGGYYAWKQQVTTADIANDLLKFESEEIGVSFWYPQSFGRATLSEPYKAETGKGHGYQLSFSNLKNDPSGIQATGGAISKDYQTGDSGRELAPWEVAQEMTAAIESCIDPESGTAELAHKNFIYVPCEPLITADGSTAYHGWKAYFDIIFYVGFLPGRDDFHVFSLLLGESVENREAIMKQILSTAKRIQ